MEIIRSNPLSKPKVVNRLNGPAFLRGFVETFSFERVVGTPANDRARDIVFTAFRSIFGKDPKIMGSKNNVVMGDPHTAEILIGAHYDSVPGTPGADDNASAVAAMMLIANNIPDTNKLCYVAFNSEEYGLAGSTEFVHDLSPNHSLKQVHILEMVGYRSFMRNSQRNPLGNLVNGMPTVGDFIGVVSNNERLIESAIEHAGTIDVPVVGTVLPAEVSIEMVRRFAPHLLRSDHAPFWDIHIPAVLWTDTAEFRNPNYHESTDAPDTLDYEFMAAVADVIIEIAKAAIA